MNIIETKNLTKSYAGFTAVSNLNLHIPKVRILAHKDMRTGYPL